MKKQFLFLITFLSLTATTFAQSKDCEKTCIVDKTLYEGAFLGVQFGSPCDRETEKGIIIVKIIENTAAAENDFKPYDVVTRINNTDVNKAVEAIKIIQALNPFDVVSISLIRNDKVITKKVVLGAKTTKVIQEEVCCEEATASLSENNISVFPNPAVDNLNISFKSLVQDDYKFGVFMANGTLVMEYTKKLEAGKLKESIPVSKLQNGIYALRISNNGTTFSKLFVVNRR